MGNKKNQKKGTTITIRPRSAVAVAQTVSHTNMTEEELARAEMDELEDDPEADEGGNKDPAQMEPRDGTEVNLELSGSDVDSEEGSSDNSVKDIGV